MLKVARNCGVPVVEGEGQCSKHAATLPLQVYLLTNTETHLPKFAFLFGQDRIETTT